MGTNYLRRLERLELGKAPGTCVACELARIADPDSQCDGESCGLGLAELLKGLEGEQCEIT